MAISVYQANATIDSVTIEIYGLNSSYRSKQFDVYLNGSFYRNYSDTTGSSSIIIITDLQEGTSYSCEVRAFCDHGNNNWQPDPATDQNYATITITTLGGGGGGGGNPTFGVSVSGSNIYITVSDYGSNPAVHAYLYDNLSDAVAKNNNDVADSYENDYQCMIQAPANGTYYVVCHYIDDNVSWIWLQDNYGYTQVEVTINSGPSPSGNYSYPWSDSANVTSTSSIEGWHSGSAYEGWFFTFNFDNSGTLRLYSSDLNGSMQSYIGIVDRSYDPSDGRPIYYDDSATGNFDFTWNGSTGDTLYLWVNSNGNSSYSFYLNAIFSGGGSTPTYTAEVIEYNKIKFTVSNRGSYYLRYFVRLSDSSSATYDSWEEDGQLATYIGLTVPNLSYDTWYTVNVGYSTIRTSGQVTWIGSMELKTGSQPVQQNGYVYIYDGSTWRKAIPYIYDGSSWREAIPYIYDGSSWRECGG